MQGGGGGHSSVLHSGSRGRAMLQITAGRNMSSCPEVTAPVGSFCCQETLCPQQTPRHNAIHTLGPRSLGKACKARLFILGGSHHGGRKVIAWPHSPGNHSEDCAGTLQSGNEMSWLRATRPDDIPHTVTTLFLRPRAIQCMSRG